MAGRWSGTLSAAAWIVATLLVSPVDGATQQAPSFPDLDPAVRVGDGLVQPCLEALEGSAECGRFRVHEDRAAGTGRTIDISFVVLRALDGQGSADAVTQFNGGPGAAVTPAAYRLGEARADLRAERDILLVDHRGTGNSMGLYCGDPFPGGIPSRFETVFPLEHITQCRARLSQRTDLTQYTTPAAMDDLAELTTWLGYDQLNLIGGSYGTREAQIFARRHPAMVRTVVMNGAAPVDERIYLYHARDLQASLDNLLDECERQPLCRTSYPNLRAVLREVLTAATNDPPQVTIEGVVVDFGIGPLSYALRGLLYGQSGTVPARLYEAHAGDWQPLAEYYFERQAWVGGARGVPAGYHYSVLCAEDIDPLSWNEIHVATAGTFMGPFLIGGYKRACDSWRSARLPDSYFTPVRSDRPALFLSGGRDPVTPVAGAGRVADGWPNSLHVIVPNGGHGQGGACIDGLVRAFIESGSAEGLDASCVESPPPTRFEISGR